MKNIESHAIDSLRAQIDEVDLDLTEALERRAELVLQIGNVKRRLGLPLMDRERERVVLSSIRKANHGPYSDEDLGLIFRTVLDCSLRLMARARSRSAG